MYWQAFARLEPYGSRAEDLRFARLAAVVANTHRDPKKKAFEVEDFLPDYDEAYVEQEVMTPEQTLELVRALSSHFGGKLGEIN